VGAREVTRRERGEQGEFARQRADGDDLREGVGVGPVGVAAAAEADDVERLGLRREFRPAADGTDFEAGEADARVQSVFPDVDGRDGVRPLDDLRGVLAGGEEDGGDGVGGGTELPTQSEALDVVGLRGGGDPAGANADALAEIIAVGALAGELSLLAALASRHLSSAHEDLGR
jgi:hypothetical protein